MMTAMHSQIYVYPAQFLVVSQYCYNGYANILKVLISKRNNGVITYNTWGIVDKIDHLGRDQNKFLFDKNLNPKPVINYLRETLTTQNTELVILE